MGRSGLAIAGLAVLGIAVAAFRWAATRPETEIRSPVSGESTDARASSDRVRTGGTGAAGYREAAEATRLGMEAYRAGDFESALDHFGNLSSLSPDNANAYLYSGLCWIRLGDLREAESFLRRALALQPSDPRAAEELIALLTETGRLVEAAEIQSNLVRQNRRDVHPVLGLARIYREQGDVEGAVEQNRKAVEMEPTNPRAWLELGDALNEAGETDEAMEAFERVLELSEGSAEAQAGLGTAFLQAGRYQEAVGPLEEAVRLDAGNAAARLHLAMTYEKLHRIEESLCEYDAYVLLANDTPKAQKIKVLVEQARTALAQKRGV